MAKARKGISELTKKRLMQECGANCSFCGQPDVSTLEYHHIDGEPSNNDYANLIVTCSSCHSRINAGEIATQDVAAIKSRLKKEGAMKQDKRPAVSVSIEGSTFKGDIAQNIYKLPRGKRPPPAPVSGTIRANPAKKAYIDYLLSKYHELRKADSSYGRNMKYNYAVVHMGIKRQFGAGVFDLPEGRFGDVVEHLQDKIDKTIQGRVNRKSGTPNYHSYEEHRGRYGF